jgi:polyferredoxin
MDKTQGLDVEPPSGLTRRNFDILRIPFLGRFLTWRWGRLLPQLSLLTLNLLVIYDGFTGRQLAPANIATVLVWVHYRGIVILVLLFFGNLFCFACPFTLLRTIAPRISHLGRRWPSFLHNKWISIAVLFVFFWLYEFYDLWASPLLTAWLVLAYFLLSFSLEVLFSESPFCKHVCPLGAFNFVQSTVSPLQIKAQDREVCRGCEGKECVNGNGQVLGCGTELFVPMINSNMDCTLCLDCARACPFDNVSLRARRPLQELVGSTWRRKWDSVALAVILLFIGLMNAFGMVPPIYRLQVWLFEAGIQLEAVQLLLIFGIGMVGLPFLLLSAASWLSQHSFPLENRDSLKAYAIRYAPALVPVGFGIWLAHYAFHFAIGGLTIVPVMQTFLIDHGIMWLGTMPNWELSYLLPVDFILPLQVVVLSLGYFSGLYILGRVALRSELEPIQSLRELLPWALMITFIIIASLLVFTQPMEMRGTVMMGP